MRGLDEKIEAIGRPISASQPSASLEAICSPVFSSQTLASFQAVGAPISPSQPLRSLETIGKPVSPSQPLASLEVDQRQIIIFAGKEKLMKIGFIKVKSAKMTFCRVRGIFE